MAAKKKARSPTKRILVQIRDEMQTEDSLRLATEVVAVARAVGQVRELLKDQRIERERMEDHERRIRALEKRSA